MTPAASVVIPTKDRWPLLRRALTGVLAQEDVALEVIVVDDGSSDGTREHCLALGDPRIRVLAPVAPHGVAHARNRGIAAASADWIALLDDDDQWAPDHLRRLLETAASAQAAMAFARHLVVDLAGRVHSTGPDPPSRVSVARLLAENVVVTPSSALLSRAAVAQAGGFDASLSILADWDQWIRLASVGPVACTHALTVAYTRHAGGMHRDVAALLAEHAALERKCAPLLRAERTGLGDQLFWQWIAALRDPARQKRRAAGLLVRHHRRHVPPRRLAAGLRRLAAAPELRLDEAYEGAAAPPWVLPAPAV